MSEGDSRDIYKDSIPPQLMDDEAHSDVSNSDDNFQHVDDVNDEDSAGEETKIFPESDEDAPYDDEAIKEPVLSDKEDECTLDSISNEKDLQTVIKSYRKRQAAERKKQIDVKKPNTSVISAHIEPSDIDLSTLKPISTKSVQPVTKKPALSTPTKTDPKKKPVAKRSNVNVKNNNDEPSNQKKKRTVVTKPKQGDRIPLQMKKRQSSETINLPSTSDATKASESNKNTYPIVKERTPRSSVADVTKEQITRNTGADSCAKDTWMKILASDFKDKDFKALLISSDFTERQANALQKTFINVSNQIHNAYKSNDRFMKTHKCLDCEFSVSHQCMSIEYLQFIPSAVELTQIGSLTPKETIMCICKFGFYHAHPSSGGVELVNKLATKHYTNRLTEHCRTVKVSCPGCKMSIVMRSRNAEVCCDFSQWMSHDGHNRKTFFSAIGNRLTNCKNNKPYLNELYTCNRQCCLIFHRCNSLENFAESSRSRATSLE
uniref:N-like protein n=1 Tax=Glypta fumiferanae TaxID=389681 RepID=A0A0F6QA52_9HYME|nr:N-like protein [Glypta fumiferanae]